MEKINQRFGTQFTAGDQVENFRALQKHVLASDARIVGLADKDNRATWDMVYDTWRAPERQPCTARPSLT